MPKVALYRGAVNSVRIARWKAGARDDHSSTCIRSRILIAVRVDPQVAYRLRSQRCWRVDQMPEIGLKYGLRAPATTGKKCPTGKQSDEARPMAEKIAS